MTGLGTSCGACRFLRRRCSAECIFAPYFSYDDASSHFAAVHKVFGASNVSKLLLHLPVHNRSAAAITISYEALARMQDPIYGCVAHIIALQQQVGLLLEEMELIGNQMATGSFQITPDLIDNQMQFSPEYNKMQANNEINQQISLPNTENQDFYGLVNEQLPQFNAWEDEVSYCNHDSDILFEWLDQDIYHHLHPWQANESILN